METELFFIFPENQKAPLKTNSFVDDAGALKEEQIKITLQRFSVIRREFRYEKYNGFYDLNNVEALIYPYMTSGAKGRGSYFNRKYILTTVLAHFTNWRKHSRQESGEVYELYNQALSGCTICEMAKRMTLNSDNAYALVNCRAIKEDLDNCTISIRTTESSKSVVIHMFCLDEVPMHQWLSLNRVPKRTYNWNKKHGENGVGAQKGESILMGSKDEAKDLLRFAVGEYYGGVLYYYDAKYQHYMEFKHEVNNQYHSFHITDIGRTPKEIKDFIDFLNA